MTESHSFLIHRFRIWISKFQGHDQDSLLFRSQHQCLNHRIFQSWQRFTFSHRVNQWIFQSWLRVTPLSFSESVNFSVMTKTCVSDLVNQCVIQWIFSSWLRFTPLSFTKSVFESLNLSVMEKNHLSLVKWIQCLIQWIFRLLSRFAPLEKSVWISESFWSCSWFSGIHLFYSVNIYSCLVLYYFIISFFSFIYLFFEIIFILFCFGNIGKQSWQ